MLSLCLTAALVLNAPAKAPKDEPLDALDFDQGTLLTEESGSYGSELGGWSAWRLADGDPGVGWCSPRDTLTGSFTWQFDGTWKLDTLVLDNTSNEEGSDVFGCYDWGNGTFFFGSITGRIARLSWEEEPHESAPGSRGTVTLAIKDDGSFWGIYFTESGELGGKWEGTKGETSPTCVPRKKGHVERALVSKGRVVLYGIRFASNSDVPLPESVPVMEELAAALKANTTMKVLLEGHTDSTNTAAYNLDLSARRAKAVVTFLVKQGIDAKRLSSKGFGKDVPVASNATAQGRALNRRVEVSVVK